MTMGVYYGHFIGSGKGDQNLPKTLNSNRTSNYPNRAVMQLKNLS